MESGGDFDERIVRCCCQVYCFCLVLLAVGYMFRVHAGFFNALLAAIVIAILGYVIESLFGEKISPQSRGMVVSYFSSGYLSDPVCY